MPADRSFSVIDIGCGTGAVGEEIAKIRLIQRYRWRRHFTRDACCCRYPNNVLMEPRLYADLHEADLTSTIYFAANHFDFFVSAGTFTIGHLGA